LKKPNLASRFDPGFADPVSAPDVRPEPRPKPAAVDMAAAGL
jgi:hypothetical protein